MESMLLEMGNEKEEHIKAGEFAEASLIHSEQELLEKKVKFIVLG